MLIKCVNSGLASHSAKYAGGAFTMEAWAPGGGIVLSISHSRVSTNRVIRLAKSSTIGQTDSVDRFAVLYHFHRRKLMIS